MNCIPRSDYNLNEILPTQAGWRALAQQAAPVLAEIAGIVDRFTPSENKRQTEDNLVVPVLRALGHTVEVQSPLKTPDGTKVPDYIFYRDDAALAAHKNQVLTEAVAIEGAFAVGDAKYWRCEIRCAALPCSPAWGINANAQAKRSRRSEWQHDDIASAP